MFPFKWEIKSRKKFSFSERTLINKIPIITGSNWENLAKPKTEDYKRELYNERNFFYDFTHQTIYDDDNELNIIQHYERKETYQQNVNYNIHVLAGKEDTYNLKIKSLNLNLYGTGVGVLIFYLENYKYPDYIDILRINQFGRRTYPPFLSLKEGVDGTKKLELADFISIEGLNGDATNYFEDFNNYTTENIWKPAKFINTLIKDDFCKEMDIKPVVDDRMFVMCWYGNNSISRRIKNNYKEYLAGNDWYRYIFVDGGDATCQNIEMHNNIIEKHTYKRWQKYGTLFGISRYSLVVISDNEWFAKNLLLTHFRTMYTRVAELCLVQRASVLRFSDEVTKISALSGDQLDELYNSISDLYKQYIRFVNKVYFREVTAQEQGIELYNKLQEVMCIPEQVKDLDMEIEELHGYVSLEIEKSRSKEATEFSKQSVKLTQIANRFLPAAVVAAVLAFISDKNFDLKASINWLQTVIIAIFVGIVYLCLKHSQAIVNFFDREKMKKK